MLHADPSLLPPATPVVDRPPFTDALVHAPPLASGPVAMAEALLKSPASIVRAMRDGERAIGRLALVVALSLVVVGLVVASFGGGVQFLLVPAKLTLGAFFCALICVPSLHVFSCLSGARQTFKDTIVALLMGIALTALLLLGFAPIAWIFSQATTSAAFMGALHLAFFVVSCVFGLGLVSRTLGTMNRGPVRGLHVWSFLFVIVAFQVATTLRPLVGPADDVLSQDRLFFVTHWLRVLTA